MVRDTTTATGDTPTDTVPDGYMSRDDVLALLAERDAAHQAEMETVRTRLPVAMVAANAGGPGYDNHQASWSLAEQEAAARGEMLDHWVINGKAYGESNRAASDSTGGTAGDRRG